jgi:hypothetical protein
MEIEAADIWRDVRDRIVRIGPLTTLRKMVANGVDLEDAFSAFVEQDDPVQVLELLGETVSAGDDPTDAAVESLQRLALGRRRLGSERKRQAEALVLRFFDSWAAQGDPVPAGRVISGLSGEIARWEFDSGYPGSGQIIRAHRFGRAIAAVSDDYGVCGVYGTVRELVRDWLASGAKPRQIVGSAVTDALLERIQGEQETDDEDSSRPVASLYKPVTRAEAEEIARQDERAGEAHERQGDARAAALDFPAAVREWRHAATYGRATAHWKLAVLFARGLCTKQDSLEAARRIRSAGDAGEPRAQLRLARAAERLLKYRESDFWQKRAAERGLTCRRLERAGQHRLVGSKDDAVRTAIERLAERFDAGEHRSAIDLVALCAASGRSAEAERWWAQATTRGGRLRVDDFLVLELSGALASLPASASGVTKRSNP